MTVRMHLGNHDLQGPLYSYYIENYKCIDSLYRYNCIIFQLKESYIVAKCCLIMCSGFSNCVINPGLFIIAIGLHGTAYVWSPSPLFLYNNVYKG